LLTAFGLTLFRILYFGYPLPNTYYAKVEPDKLLSTFHGAKYLLHFLLAYKIAAVLCGLAIGSLVVAWAARPCLGSKDTGEPPVPQSRPRLFIACALVMTGLLLPVPGGGDHFAAFRFYQSVWPLFILPALCLLHQFVQRNTLLWIIALTFVPIFFLSDPISWHNIAASPDLSLDREFELARTGRRTGMALNTLFPDRPPSVGVITAGGIAMTYRGPCVDLLGLNNVTMGHSPGDRQGPKNHAAFDPSIFWLLHPNIVHPVMRIGGTDEAACRDVEALAMGLLKNLPEDREFRIRYLLAVVRPATGDLVPDLRFYVPRGMPPDFDPSRQHGPQLLVAYFDRATLDRVRQSGFTVKVYQTIRK
jgi:hypothetical protein